MKKRKSAFFAAPGLLIMQLINICIFTNTVYANAQTLLDKKVNITVNQVEVKKLLHEIQKQTGIEFAYSSDIINVNKRVSCTLANKKLSDFLFSVLKPLGIEFTVIDDKQILLLNASADRSSSKSHAEEVEMYYPPSIPLKVKGTVTSEKGTPMGGVTVVVRGSNTIVATDDDGKFSITVPYAEATLAFSFIGYQSQEIPLEGRTTLSVVLKEDAQNLKDVVVIGYALKRKSR